MLKDYYDILGITEDATIVQIKAAYRTQALKWHPDRNPGEDTSEKMKEINEAYSILSNPESRARYDKEYAAFKSFRTQKTQQNTTDCSNDDYDTNNDYDIKDEELKRDVEKARKSAEEFVREFYAALKKESASAAKGAWEGAKPYLIAAVIMTIIGIIISLASSSSGKISYTSEPMIETPVMTESDSSLPDGWITYKGGTAFQITIPPTVELRNENDAYSQSLKSLSLTHNDGNIVFQQEGLSRQEPEAYDRYCRIMIQYISGTSGDFLKSTETETLDYEWQAIFDDLVEGSIGPAANLMGGYSYDWTTINGAKCIKIDYRRTGNNFDTSIPVVCRIAIFQNNDEMVKLILSYREKEAFIWKEDFDRVFESFKWI